LNQFRSLAINPNRGKRAGPLAEWAGVELRQRQARREAGSECSKGAGSGGFAGKGAVAGGTGNANAAGVDCVVAVIVVAVAAVAVAAAHDHSSPAHPTHYAVSNLLLPFPPPVSSAALW